MESLKIPQMKIVSHRGVWKHKSQQNTLESICLAFESGLGCEIDVRDYASEIVISHDVPCLQPLKLCEVLKTCKDNNVNPLMAINIKSDGLCDSIKSLMEEYDMSNYFVFDMSLPDTLSYADRMIPFCVRRSEYEPETPFELYSQCSGVWLDSFCSDWWDSELVMRLLGDGKFVAVVSPELHRRNKDNTWFLLKNLKNLAPKTFYDRILLCTDNPIDALRFFR